MLSRSLHAVAAARRVQRRSLCTAAQGSAPAPVPTVYHPSYSLPKLPPGCEAGPRPRCSFAERSLVVRSHRFPMQVFRTIYERLLRTGVVAASQIHVPAELVSRDVLALAHCPAYVDAFCAGALPPDAMRRIGFPWSPELVERTLAEVSPSGRYLVCSFAYARTILFAFRRCLAHC